MKESQKRYKKKITTRRVDFYPGDQKMLETSKQINFQRYVKKCLENYNIISNELFYIFMEGE